MASLGSMLSAFHWNACVQPRDRQAGARALNVPPLGGFFEATSTAVEKHSATTKRMLRGVSCRPGL